MVPVRDLAGQTFGRWTVIARDLKTDNRGNAHWMCECACGKRRVIMTGNLTRGLTTSCGCSPIGGVPLKARGLIGTPEYRAWIQMRRRCYDPQYTNYESWGGRGITVCDDWREDFRAFLAYVGPRPSPGYLYSIDRINNDGNYEPGNVRWATRREQARNRRPPKPQGGT